MDIRETLLKLVLDNTPDAGDDVLINDDTLLIEDLAYDSAAIIRLMVDMEETFSIEFDDTDLLSDKINKFGDLLALVTNLIEKKGETNSGN